MKEAPYINTKILFNVGLKKFCLILKYPQNTNNTYLCFLELGRDSLQAKAARLTATIAAAAGFSIELCFLLKEEDVSLSCGDEGEA